MNLPPRSLRLPLLLAFAFATVVSTLTAAPKIESLLGFTLGQPLDKQLAEKLTKRGMGIKTGQLTSYVLSKLPEYRQVEGIDTEVYLSCDRDKIVSVEVRFLVNKNRREPVYRWVEEQTGVDGRPFADGRLHYSPVSDKTIRSLTLGSYIMGQEDKTFSVSISEQKR